MDYKEYLKLDRTQRQSIMNKWRSEVGHIDEKKFVKFETWLINVYKHKKESK